MLPLLIKDGLLIPFVGMSILFYLFNSLVYMSDSDTHTQPVTKPGRAKKYTPPERTQRKGQNPPLYLRVLVSEMIRNMISLNNTKNEQLYVL